MDAEGDAESKALFAQVQFHIVKTEDFPPDHAAAVCLTRGSLCLFKAYTRS